MEEHAGADLVRFSGFRFDRRRGCLFRKAEDGALTAVAIGSRALDVLGLLIDRHGDLVSKDEIMDAVWPGVVEGANVTVQISALRRVLDEGRSEPSLIQTVPGRGYRFVAPVTGCEAEPRAQAGRVKIAPADEFASAPVTQAPIVPIAASPRRRGAALVIAGAFLALLVLTAGVWRLWLVERTAAVQRVAAAASITSLVAPRLSIVVLPFVNLSNDPGQQYFADGITEDLTTHLARIGHSFVISRNTAFTYRNKLADTKQIGRELGVRYVLEGSVQRSDRNVRVNVQLIDVGTDANLWAEQFDGEKGDLFLLQNDITRRIANALIVELVAAEAARPTDHPDALDYFLRARAVMDKPKTRETYAEAISLFDRALTLDPRAVEAQSRLSIHLSGRVLGLMTEAAAADIARADGLAGQVLAASLRSPLAHFTKGMVLEAQKRLEEGAREYETAVTLNRNDASAYAHMGYIKRSMGSPEEAIPLLEQAIRISPRDPDVGTWYEVMGQAYLLQSRIDAAVVWAEKARADNPARPSLRALLASAYALNDESERAATELAEARRLSTDDRYSSIYRLKTLSSWRPKTLALCEPTYLAGLRKAGMPEE
jgi:adenylate cyclase